MGKGRGSCVRGAVGRRWPANGAGAMEAEEADVVQADESDEVTRRRRRKRWKQMDKNRGRE
jgi:hypothetical protein